MQSRIDHWFSHCINPVKELGSTMNIYENMKFETFSILNIFYTEPTKSILILNCGIQSMSINLNLISSKKLQKTNCSFGNFFHTWLPIDLAKVTKSLKQLSLFSQFVEYVNEYGIRISRVGELVVFHTLSHFSRLLSNRCSTVYVSKRNFISFILSIVQNCIWKYVTISSDGCRLILFSSNKRAGTYMNTFGYNP